MDPTQKNNTQLSLRFEAIDGLRAIGAIGIVLMHILANIGIKPSPCFLTLRVIPWFTDFTLLFMIISGFSVSCGYFHRIKIGQISPAEFYKKRYIRLVPFFALMCVIALIASPSVKSAAEFFTNITLTNGLIPDVEFNIIGVGWFMGVVMLFYIFFPFLVAIQDNKRNSLITLLGAILIVWISLSYSNVAIGTERRSILYCLPLFMSGIVIFHFFEKMPKITPTLNRLILLIALLASALPFLTEYSAMTTLLVSIAVFSLWTIYAISQSSQVAEHKLLNNRLTRYIASVSLEIYLCHMMIFRIVEAAHLEKYISNSNILYLTTCVLVIIGAIFFSHIVKFKILNPIISRFFKN